MALVPSSPRSRRLAIALFVSAVSVAAAPPPAPPSAPPDHSLTPSAYIELGLPASDREWTGEDYVQAAKVLTELAKGDETRLPRFESPVSGSVFQRLVSEDNLRLARNRSLPTLERLRDGVASLDGIKTISVLYVPATQDGSIFEAELIEILKSEILVARELLVVAVEFRAGLPPDDPKREAREKGFEQMRQGLTTMVVGVVVALENSATLSVRQTVGLATTLEAVLPDFLPHFTPSVRQELQVRIKGLMKDDTDPALKERLVRIQTMLAK